MFFVLDGGFAVADEANQPRSCHGNLFLHGVGYRDELSNFIRDFKSIVDFIKQYSFLGL